MHQPTHPNWTTLPCAASHTCIAADKVAEIQRRLHQAETDHQIKVLHAIESGSRAWGFASPNSDYDGRFIYINQPDWYLSVGLEEQRDVIEQPLIGDMDVNGWDLRKALRLYLKSNPGFVEWILSPIVYQSNGSFVQAARELLPTIYCVDKGIYHYRSMAMTNFRGYLQQEWVPLKKYFYVLRPLLSVRWLEQYQCPAPIEFRQLLHTIEPQRDLCDAIEQLLLAKSNSPELGLAPQVPEIQNFIVKELQRLSTWQGKSTTTDSTAVHLLSDLFRQQLAASW